MRSSDPKAAPAMPSPGRKSPRIAGNAETHNRRRLAGAGQQEEGQRDDGGDGQVGQDPQDQVEDGLALDHVGEPGDAGHTRFVLGEQDDRGHDRRDEERHHHEPGLPHQAPPGRAVGHPRAGWCAVRPPSRACRPLPSTTSRRGRGPLGRRPQPGCGCQPSEGGGQLGGGRHSHCSVGIRQILRDRISKGIGSPRPGPEAPGIGRAGAAGGYRE